MNYKAELEVGDEVKVTGAKHQSWMWAAGTYKVEEKVGKQYKLRHTIDGKTVCYFYREQLTPVVQTP